MAKAKSSYDEMTFEQVVERCEMYRRQLGAMNAALNRSKKKVKDLEMQLYHSNELVAELKEAIERYVR